MTDATFKGVTLSTKGIIIQSIDWFKKPQRRNEQKYIDGNDGATIIEYGYDPFTITANIGLTDMTKLDEVMALLDGAGVLTFSGDAGKYRNAKVLEQVDYEKLMRFKTAEVQFFIDIPFRYIVAEADQTMATFPATINNPGTVISWPLLKITGTGFVNITLNGVNFTYNFDTPYVYIDCVKGDSRGAYHLTVLKNGQKTGGYPFLNQGDNTLTVNSGIVTQIVVTKRSKYL